MNTPNTPQRRRPLVIAAWLLAAVLLTTPVLQITVATVAPMVQSSSRTGDTQGDATGVYVVRTWIADYIITIRHGVDDEAFANGLRRVTSPHVARKAMDVPETYAFFAYVTGVPLRSTHLGFVPNPGDPRGYDDWKCISVRFSRFTLIVPTSLYNIYALINAAVVVALLSFLTLIIRTTYTVSRWRWMTRRGRCFCGYPSPSETRASVCPECARATTSLPHRAADPAQRPSALADTPTSTHPTEDGRDPDEPRSPLPAPCPPPPAPPYLGLPAVVVVQALGWAAPATSNSMSTGLSRRSLDAFAAARRMILVSVVIGCMISLFVAVGIRYFGGAFGSPYTRVTHSEDSMSGYAAVGRFRSHVSFCRWNTTSWAVVEPWWLTVDPERYTDYVRFSVYASGWPVPCLYSVSAEQRPPRRSDHVPIDKGVIRIAKRHDMSGQIPYFVLWKGLAVNTVVYASVVLAIWSATIACVPAIRARRAR